MAPQKDMPHVVSHDEYLRLLGNRSQTHDLVVAKVLIKNLPMVNAQFGEYIGGSLIDEVWRVIQRVSGAEVVSQVSPSLFALYGGDPTAPSKLLNSIKATADEINASGKYPFLVEFSIGAVVTEHSLAVSPEDWVTKANTAMLASGRSGFPELSNHSGYVREIVREALGRLTAESTIPEGMHWVYQPINDAKTGEVFGYEALCRWSVPGLGEVSPEVFIQVAEELHVVEYIDFWALDAIGVSHHELMKRGGKVISINVSAQTLAIDDRFFELMNALVDRNRECNCQLILELTETSLVLDHNDLLLKLTSLRERGVNIAIDDFGTGQTSLSAIGTLPCDFVKLDGSLLQVSGRALSLGLLELGKRFADLLGARVIVEKVETESDLALVREVGAEFAQGWYFGQAIDLRAEVAVPD